MDKLTDLELITAIAKIEGFNYDVRRDSVCPCDPTDVIVHKLTDVYNPLTDKAMLWDLFIKYGVTIDRYLSECYIIEFDCDVDGAILSEINFEDIDGIPRAGLECIVEANNG
jgi:hypothetical protein